MAWRNILHSQFRSHWLRTKSKCASDSWRIHFQWLNLTQLAACEVRIFQVQIQGPGPWDELTRVLSNHKFRISRFETDSRIETQSTQISPRWDHIFLWVSINNIRANLTTNTRKGCGTSDSGRISPKVWDGTIAWLDGRLGGECGRKSGFWKEIFEVCLLADFV